MRISNTRTGFFNRRKSRGLFFRSSTFFDFAGFQDRPGRTWDVGFMLGWATASRENLTAHDPESWANR